MEMYALIFSKERMAAPPVLLPYTMGLNASERLLLQCSISVSRVVGDSCAINILLNINMPKADPWHAAEVLF